MAADEPPPQPRIAPRYSPPAAPILGLTDEEAAVAVLLQPLLAAIVARRKAIARTPEASRRGGKLLAFVHLGTRGELSQEPFDFSDQLP